MREIFTTSEAYKRGLSSEALKWGVRKGKWVRIAKGVYVEGPQVPNKLERALGRLRTSGGMAAGSLAGVLYELDSVGLDRGVNVRPANNPVNVNGFLCMSGPEALLDLATRLDDLKWEQALECALRKKLTTIDEIVAALETSRYGNKRIRRVLALRPDGALPAESLLETLAIQLMRSDSALPIPTRQFEVFNQWGRFEARVDLAFPDHGVFFELDGQQHKDQPVYDANRQTRVVAATGWLVGRYTWDEIVRNPRATVRRIAELFATAARVRVSNPD